MNDETAVVMTFSIGARVSKVRRQAVENQRTDRVGQIARMRDVRHAEVDPHDKVFLHNLLAVEVLCKIDDRVVRIVGVVGVRRVLLVVFVLGHRPVLGRKVLRAAVVSFRASATAKWTHLRSIEVRRLLNCQVDAAAANGHHAIARVLAKLVLVVLVRDEPDVFALSLRVPVLHRLVFDAASLQLHRLACVVRPWIRLFSGHDRIAKQRVAGAENVEVDAEVERVLVHASAQAVVDLIAVVLVVSVICRLDV